MGLVLLWVLWVLWVQRVLYILMRACELRAVLLLVDG